MTNQTRDGMGGWPFLNALYKGCKGEPASGIGAWRKGKELAFVHAEKEGRIVLETATYTLNLTYDVFKKMLKDGDSYLVQELYHAILREGDRLTMQGLINALICGQDFSLVQRLEGLVGGRIEWPTR